MTVVVGVGQPLAGDDGVGRVVALRLRQEGIAALEAGDGASLLALLDGASRAVVIDAAVGAGPPGQVRVLRPGELPAGVHPVSSHGLSVPEALQLARVLDPALEVTVVAVSIAEAPIGAEGLSPPVTAAVEEAAARVRTLIG